MDCEGGEGEERQKYLKRCLFIFITERDILQNISSHFKIKCLSSDAQKMCPFVFLSFLLLSSFSNFFIKAHRIIICTFFCPLVAAGKHL